MPLNIETKPNQTNVVMHNGIIVGASIGDRKTVKMVPCKHIIIFTQPLRSGRIWHKVIF